jgi:DNA-directed RNA polymerase sigma subunit (sigma70/sigma32)
MEQNIQILFDYITFKMSWLPSAMQSYINDTNGTERIPSDIIRNISSTFIGLVSQARLTLKRAPRTA